MSCGNVKVRSSNVKVPYWYYATVKNKDGEVFGAKQAGTLHVERHTARWWHEGNGGRGGIGKSVSQERCFELNSCRYWQSMKRPENGNVREFLEVENKQYFESPRGGVWQMLVVQQWKSFQKDWSLELGRVDVEHGPYSPYAVENEVAGPGSCHNMVHKTELATIDSTWGDAKKKVPDVCETTYIYFLYHTHRWATNERKNNNIKQLGKVLSHHMLPGLLQFTLALILQSLELNWRDETICPNK